jgi:Fur family peroxide stress response transcriptional regulator
MTDPRIRFNELIAILKERKFRLTPQRMELVRLIAASEGHPSAAQLYDRIQDQFPTMSLATVYKVLALLKDMNQVQEIDLGGDRHYDGNNLGPHSHLVCIECNRIVDGDLDPGSATIKKLEKETGYRILQSQFSFYGLCPECQKKRR